MPKQNIVQEKSYQFAVKIVKVCRKLQVEEKEYILSRQLLKSGTSIGANIEESIAGQSAKDFVSKLSISYKEARESKYWIRLLFDSELISENNKVELLKDVEEILKLLGAIKRTMQKRINS